ncbi:MAG TPA: Rieske (2Fe-2S) protein [Xanthobacteraceae bacterium]
MREVNIGAASEFGDPGRKVIAFENFEVGVFKLGGEFYAWLNHCPHMGGPACQGKIIPKVDEVIAADRTSKGMAFSKTQLNVVCPWHGYEFDIRSGRHAGNSTMRLRPMAVRVAGGDVILTVPDRREHVAPQAGAEA